MFELKELLEKFRRDKTIIVEIYSKYNINEIIKIAIENNMDDVIIDLFQPIEINGEYEQFYDYYSVLNTGYIEYNDMEHLKNMKKDIDIANSHIRNMKLKKSLPRQISGWGCLVSNEDDVRFYAEPACLDSMLYLFQNRITTTMNDTRCLKDDPAQEQGICEVWIRYDILSDENKKEVSKMLDEGLARFVDREEDKTVSIFVPCNCDETIGEVSDRLLDVVKRLKKQIPYRGVMTINQVFDMLVSRVRDYIYDGELIPNSEERYTDLFIDYVEEGLIKSKKIDEWNGNFSQVVETEEGIYSLLDFLKVVKEIRPEIIENLISRVNTVPIYYDQEEDRYWLSEDMYKTYIEEKEKLEKDKKLNN